MCQSRLAFVVLGFAPQERESFMLGNIAVQFSGGPARNLMGVLISPLNHSASLSSAGFATKDVLPLQ